MQSIASDVLLLVRKYLVLPKDIKAFSLINKHCLGTVATLTTVEKQRLKLNGGLVKHRNVNCDNTVLTQLLSECGPELTLLRTLLLEKTSNCTEHAYNNKRTSTDITFEEAAAEMCTYLKTRGYATGDQLHLINARTNCLGYLIIGAKEITLPNGVLTTPEIRNCHLIEHMSCYASHNAVLSPLPVLLLPLSHYQVAESVVFDDYHVGVYFWAYGVKYVVLEYHRGTAGEKDAKRLAANLTQHQSLCAPYQGGMGRLGLNVPDHCAMYYHGVDMDSLQQ